MSVRPEPTPDNEESPVQQLRMDLNKMSIIELCELMIDIQAKIIEVARRTNAKRK
jgi:hypothetical protein